MKKIHCPLPLMCLLSLLAAGCLSPNRSPEPSYYQLQPLKSEAKPAGLPFPVILSPVEIAEYLDNPRMVRRTRTHQLRYLDGHRWAEPLDENIADVLRVHLSPETETTIVHTDPSTVNAPRLDLRILRFEAAPGGHAHLDLFFTLTPENHSERIRLDTPVEGDTWADAVAAQSRLLAELGVELIRRIEANASPETD